MFDAIVLAGGLGTRLRSAVPDLPKPMAPVAGRPFLAHLLDYWIGQGVRRFTLAVGYRHEAIQDHFGSAYGGATLRYTVETAPLGTGGALISAAREFPADRRFLLLNGDTSFAVDLPALAMFAKEHDTDWCLALFRTCDTARFLGMVVDERGRIRALRAAHPAGEVSANGGVYLVHPRALADVAWDGSTPLSLETGLLPQGLANGRCLGGLVVPAPFIDIGVPQDWRRSAEVLARQAQAAPARQA